MRLPIIPKAQSFKTLLYLWFLTKHSQSKESGIILLRPHQQRWKTVSRSGTLVFSGFLPSATAGSFFKVHLYKSPPHTYYFRMSSGTTSPVLTQLPSSNARGLQFSSHPLRPPWVVSLLHQPPAGAYPRKDALSQILLQDRNGPDCLIFRQSFL